MVTETKHRLNTYLPIFVRVASVIRETIKQMCAYFLEWKYQNSANEMGGIDDDYDHYDDHDDDDDDEGDDDDDDIILWKENTLG